MKIPVGQSGFPTVSPTMLRSYGAGGFRLDDQESNRGCPRQFHAKYVERRVPNVRSDRMEYGSFFHDVMHRLERDDVTPDEALDAAFPVGMAPEFYAEAKRDLDAYLERGASPSDRYATVSSETDIHQFLYEDDEFGPIWVRGILDWVGVDPDIPHVVHVVDYKTNQAPPSTDDVRGDVQLKTYSYLAKRFAEQVLKIANPVVVVHLDAVKWREVEVSYSDADMEAWHSWVVAVVRKILRDEDHLPVLNPDCAWCPVKDDCPAFIALPDTAGKVAAHLVEGLAQDLADPVQLLRWRNAANRMRLLLEKAVRSADEQMTEKARRDGELLIGDWRWTVETAWSNEVDLRRLAVVMGDSFFDVVSTSKTKIEAAVADWPASEAAAALSCVSRVPSGTTVVKKQLPKPLPR